MKVIVIRQPWAWLIVHGFKDIENRTWATRYRGTLLIQASAGRPTKRKLEEARLFARKRGIELPEDFERGGIVGMVQLKDCVTRSSFRGGGVDIAEAIESQLQGKGEFVGGGEKGYQFGGRDGARYGVTLWPAVGAVMGKERLRSSLRPDYSRS